MKGRFMGYLTCYNKPLDLDGIIKERASYRTYQDKPLATKDKDALVSFFDVVKNRPAAETIRFYLTEHDPRI